MRGIARLGLLVAVTACSSGTVKPTDPGPGPTNPEPTTKPATEYRGVLSIDPEPGGKKFQGVWLDAAGKRFVLAYRAAELWRWFEGREVVLTGGCYQPFGQAINATHFDVESLRVAEEQQGVGPYFSFGAKKSLVGEVIEVEAPAGSKLAGSKRRVFRADDGDTFELAGGDVPDVGRHVRVRVRVLDPDMSYVARTNGPDLWIDDVQDAADEDAWGPVDNPIACP